MRSSTGARRARQTVCLTLSVAVCLGGLGASTALARPGVGAAPVGPTQTGHVVNAGCSNPANLLGSGAVLPAASVTAGTQLRCFAQAVSRAGQAGPEIMAGPTGMSPSNIQGAYKLTGANAAGRTVAVVDAYNDPDAAADLAVYRAAYGLAPCTTASGCFKQVNQTGADSPLPAGNPSWAIEESLDLDAVSAACPTCHILLVEANSSLNYSLAAAVDAAAATPGVVAISNSYGGDESFLETAYDKSGYSHSGIAITASTGDDGYGVEYPAASPDVTAVGGTTLTPSANARGWTETAWGDAGSGCSRYEAKPSWQTDTGCAKRTVADVSADANPNSGLAIYDTYNRCGSSSFCDRLIEMGVFQGLDGWAQFGGTSLSSPLIASVYALAGNTASISNGSYPYSHTGSLYDVTSGSNGDCSAAYLCTAGTGYDGPTGLGTPDGTGAF